MSTGVEVDTSFGEVYFFGPKSILLLLKYGLNILLKLICPIEQKKATGGPSMPPMILSFLDSMY